MTPRCEGMLIKYKRLLYNKKYSSKIEKPLKKWSKNAFTFSKGE